MFDRFDRTITYLRISVTDRCNLRCTYCAGIHSFIPKKHSDMLTYEQIRDIVKQAAGLRITKVRLTGGEPLVRKQIEILVRYISDIDEIKELTMTTNGTLLAEKAEILKQNGLDRINISLDTLVPERYTQITGCGDITDVFKGIEAAVAAGFTNTKINMVVIPDINTDEIEPMRRFCSEQGLDLQLIRQFSLADQKTDTVKYNRPPSCSECNKIRLLADGTVKPCLHTNIELKIDMDDIKGSLLKAVELKPEQGTVCENRGMQQIGG